MPSPSHTAWSISEGSQLVGVPPIHGNKNAALPAIAASLLLPIHTTLTLDNVPRIRDVETLLEILTHLGVSSAWTDTQQLTLRREHMPDSMPDIPATLTNRIRASITLLGPLGGLYERCSLPKPGGDKIGGRPIGAHITALNDVGIEISDSGTSLVCERATASARGGTILLTEQSVTATLMLLLYSGFISSTDQLTIMDAACEPHVVTLCTLLESMGATITGIYSNLIQIRWPHGRHAPRTSIRLDDDFMEASTYAVAAAITRSDLSIPFQNAAVYLFLIDRYLGWMGIHTRLERDCWHILGSTSTRVIDEALTTIKAEPWPRFPTDVMSVFVVLATQCIGTLKFVEYMYDDRFGFIQSLKDIGANIESMPPHAIRVHGSTLLHGNDMFLRSDIRSGAAMLLASMASHGTTILHDRNHIIERGYQALPESLASLGARITRHSVSFDV